MVRLGFWGIPMARFNTKDVTRLGWLILQKSSRSNQHGWPEEDRCELAIAAGSWQHYDKRGLPLMRPLARSRILSPTRVLPTDSGERAFDALSLLEGMANGTQEFETQLWKVLWQEFHLVTLPWLTEELLTKPPEVGSQEANRRIVIRLDVPGITFQETEQDDELSLALTLQSRRMKEARVRALEASRPT